MFLVGSLQLFLTLCMEGWSSPCCYKAAAFGWESSHMAHSEVQKFFFQVSQHDRRCSDDKLQFKNLFSDLEVQGLILLPIWSAIWNILKYPYIRFVTESMGICAFLDWQLQILQNIWNSAKGPCLANKTDPRSSVWFKSSLANTNIQFAPQHY